MILKTISLTRELEDKLRGEANISGLIRSLLEKHYSGKLVSKMTREEKDFAMAEYDLDQKHKKEMKKLYDNNKRTKG